MAPYGIQSTPARYVQPWAEHVDGDEPEMIGMRSEVAGVRLGVAADAVQRQNERLGRVAGLDAADPDSAGVRVVLLEGNAPQIHAQEWPYSAEISIQAGGDMKDGRLAAAGWPDDGAKGVLA